MSGKAAFIGFLAVQAAIVGVYLTSLTPLTQPGAPSFIASDVQIWSGRVFSDISTNFRSRSAALAAANFNALGGPFWSALLMAGSGAAALIGLLFFRRDKVWLAAGLAVLALATGAGAASFIVEQWSGDTSFPPGAVNSVWLYMTTRSFLIQLFIAFVLFAVSTVAAIAGVVTAQKPYGFQWIVVNWIIAALAWVVIYAALYLAPTASASPA